MASENGYGPRPAMATRDYADQLHTRLRALEESFAELNKNVNQEIGTWKAYRHIMATWAVPITLLLIFLWERFSEAPTP